MTESNRPQVGEHWAYRIGRSPGNPVIPVEILQWGPPSSKHKVRVKYLAGEYAGLDEWVPKVRLHVPWSEAEAWLSDQLYLAEAFAADDELYSETLYWAVNWVFGSLDDPQMMELGYNSRERGVLEISDVSEAAAVLQLDASDLLERPLAFVDRFGLYRAPFGVALELAERACRLYPNKVMKSVGRQEEQYRRGSVEGMYEGKHYYAPEVCLELLHDHEPEFAQIRVWCGEAVSQEFDRIVALEDEIKRLRKIIEEQVSWLRFAGHPRLAKMLATKLAETQYNYRVMRSSSGLTLPIERFPPHNICAATHRTGPASIADYFRNHTNDRDRRTRSAG